MINYFLIGKLLITVATVAYGFVPPFADLNKTHATNPLWTGHARFHVVWQVMITFCMAMLGLYFLWVNNNCVVPFLLGFSVLGSFFLNITLMKLYGGTLADKNGISKIVNINSNLLSFSIALVLLTTGFLLMII
jgi:hypothetical protein